MSHRNSKHQANGAATGLQFESSSISVDSGVGFGGKQHFSVVDSPSRIYPAQAHFLPSDLMNPKPGATFSESPITGDCAGKSLTVFPPPLLLSA